VRISRAKPLSILWAISLPLADGVRRNASLVQRSGAFLASSHPRTVAGLVNMRGALAQSEEPLSATHGAGQERVDGAQRQVQRVMRLADVSADLTDPATQPAEACCTIPCFFLVIPEQLRSTPLSEREQAALSTYAHRGGTLICDPQLPGRRAIRKSASRFGNARHGYRCEVARAGNGRVVIWRTDFYSWVHTDESLAASRERPEAAAVYSSSEVYASGTRVSSPVLRSENRTIPCYSTNWCQNAATGPFGAVRADCHPAESCAEVCLAFRNWGDDQAQDTIRILETTTNMRAATPDDYVGTPDHMPPRESLMLPLNASLCTDA